MFNAVEPLDRERHRQLTLTPTGSYGFAAGLMSSPVGLSEVGEVARWYPIVFPPEGLEPMPQALFTVSGRGNAFLTAEAGWDAPYIPAHIRRYPFILGTGDEAPVLIETAAPHFQGDAGIPLFTAEGEVGEELKRIVSLLQLIDQDSRRTLALAQTISAAGLLVTREVEMQRPGQAPLRLRGLRVVDEEKFKAVPGETLAAWRDSAALALVYAHLFSLPLIKAVGDREIARPLPPLPAEDAPPNGALHS